MYKVAHYSLYTRFLIKLSDCVVVIQCDYLPLAAYPLYPLSHSPP